jgi:peptide/nickel transport system substrate-binding protein
VGGRSGTLRARTRLGLVALVVAGTMVVSPGVASAEAAAGGQPKSGGTVTFTYMSEPTSLLPDGGLGANVGLGGSERFAIYDALAVLTTKGELRNRLAESITPKSDTVWTIKLRKGRVFSDGTPVDASAVQYNWSRIADPAQPSPSASIAQQIASMNVLDPTTLEVTLKEPNAQFPGLVAQSSLTFIGSPTAWDAAGAAFGSSPVGAGAYMVQEWQRGAQLTLERNPKYKGKTYVDQLVAKYIPDETQRLNTLTTGGADIDITGQVEAVTTAKQQPNLTDSTAAQSGGNNIFFNLTQPPFDDLRARQAIAYAFDGKAMNNAVNGGRGLLAPNLFLKDSDFHSNIAQPKPDKKKAQELLDQLAEEGKPLEFTVQTTQTFQKMAEWFQARLSSFENVKMNIESVSGTQLTQSWRAGNFTMSFNSVPRFIDPAPALSNAYETGGSTNFGKYSNPEVDSAFKAARTSNDVAARKDAYDKVQRAQIKDLPSFFFLHTVVYVLYNKDKIQGVQLWGDGIPLWDRMSVKSG